MANAPAAMPAAPTGGDPTDPTAGGDQPSVAYTIEIDCLTDGTFSVSKDDAEDDQAAASGDMGAADAGGAGDDSAAAPQTFPTIAKALAAIVQMVSANPPDGSASGDDEFNAGFTGEGTTGQPASPLISGKD